MRVSATAHLTRAAGQSVRLCDHPVTGLQIFDRAADSLDLTDELMPQNHRNVIGEHIIVNVNVCSADTSLLYTDQDIILCFDLWLWHIFDFYKAYALCGLYHCLHHFHIARPLY